MHASPLGTSSQLPGGDEDAAGESDDGGVAEGEKDESFRKEAGAGPQPHTAADESQTGQKTSGEPSHRPVYRVI